MNQTEQTPHTSHPTNGRVKKRAEMMEESSGVEAGLETDSATATDSLGTEGIELDSVIEATEEIVQQVKEMTESTVRKYPVQSALVCVGVGYLLGRLFSRR